MVAAASGVVSNLEVMGVDSSLSAFFPFFVSFPGARFMGGAGDRH